MKTISFSDTVVDMTVSLSEQLIAVMSTSFFDVYHLGTFELLQYIHNKRGAGTNQKIAFTADGGILVLASEGIAMRWERVKLDYNKKWTVKLHWPLHAQKNFYHCIEHAGHYVFAHNSFVYVVDRKGTILFEYNMGWNCAHMSSVRDLVMLVSYALPSKIRFATLPPCRFLPEQMIVVDHVVRAIAVSSFIAVAYQDTVDFYSINQKAFSLKVPTRIQSLVFTPDGTMLWVMSPKKSYLIAVATRVILRQWDSISNLTCITNSKAIVSVGEQVKWITFMDRSLLLSMLYQQPSVWIKPFKNRFCT